MALRTEVEPWLSEKFLANEVLALAIFLEFEEVSKSQLWLATYAHKMFVPVAATGLSL